VVGEELINDLIDIKSLPYVTMSNVKFNIRKYYKEPLYRNSLSLLFTNILGSLFGLIF